MEKTQGKSEIENTGEVTAKPNAALAGVAPQARFSGEADLPLVARPKVHVEKTEKPVTWKKALATEDFYQAEVGVRCKCVPKATEVEFSLRSPRLLAALIPRWKAKRTTKWDEHREWKNLTALHSPSVELLRERVNHMEIQEVELMH